MCVQDYKSKAHVHNHSISQMIFIIQIPYLFDNHNGDGAASPTSCQTASVIKCSNLSLWLFNGGWAVVSNFFVPHSFAAPVQCVSISARACLKKSKCIE